MVLINPVVIYFLIISFQVLIEANTEDYFILHYNLSDVDFPHKTYDCCFKLNAF